MMWYKTIDQELQIAILAKPNAKKTALVSITDEALHISLHAKPQNGEANKELIAFLSKLFKTPKTHIILLKGEGGRLKKLSLPLTKSTLKCIEHINDNAIQ